MIKYRNIFVFLVLTSSPAFSQSFNNLDSLLAKNFEAVNKRDSVYYLSIIDQKTLLFDKKMYYKNDSAAILNPFINAFRDLIEEFAEMTVDPNFSVTYSNYEFRNKRMTEAKDGNISLHVILILNNNLSVKIPFNVLLRNGQYSIVSPMVVMFVESKE